MSYHDIKLRPTDTKFSLYIRAKRRWTCEYCKRICRDWTGETIFYKLEASHYFGRKHENTRFDEENVRVLCFLCHKDLGGYTKAENGEYDLWIKRLLGEQGYKKLMLRAFTYKKQDDKMDMLIINQLIKQNGDGRETKNLTAK